MSDKKKILASSSPSFLSILKELYKRGEYEIVTLNQNLAESLNNIDVKSQPIGSFVNEKTRVDAVRYSLMIISKYMDCVSEEMLDSLDPKRRNFIENNFGVFMNERLTNAAILAGAIDDVKPDIVMVHNDVDVMSKTVAMWASNHGVPCLHVPHSVYIDSDERGKPGTDVHDLVSATHIAVSGEYQKNWYLKRGVPEDRIKITGLPQMDKMTRIGHTRERAKSLLKVDHSKPTIVYASSWRQDTNILGCHDGVQEYYAAFLDAITSIQDRVQFVVKTHPNSSDFKAHVMMAKDKGVHCALTSQYLDVVLKASDIVFAYGPSNVLIEASYIPTTRLMTSHGYDDDVEVVKIGRDAPEKDIIVGVIKEMLARQPPNYARFRAKYSKFNDGNNYLRVADYIDELCQ